MLEQLHDGECFIVAFASRSLTSSEQNYSQIEKENLSILFACTKYDEYLYGIDFYVYNNHLPLKSIFKKSTTKAPARIQRFFIRLQKYRFEMHYKGEKLTLPDALSNSPLSDQQTHRSDLTCPQYFH